MIGTIAVAVSAVVLAAGALALLGIGAYRWVLAVRAQREAEERRRLKEEQARFFAECGAMFDFHLRFAGRWPQRERPRA